MISIIVPIYKVEKYIKQCVSSILAQTYKDIEVILVDDGSPDNCPAICDEFAKSDKRVKVIHKENGGLMSARQAGLRAASGEYVGFVDGDDWIESDMYENFAKVIEQYNPDMALCEFYFSYQDRDETSSQNLSKEFYNKSQMTEEIYPTMLFKDRFYNFGINPCCWSKVFKKQLLENNLYKVTPKIKIGEDAAFTYPCLLEAKSLAYVDKKLYHYRINPKSMTKSYDPNYESTILIPYNILKDTFAGQSDHFQNQLDYYLLYLSNGVLRNEASKSNKKSFSQIKKTLREFISNSDISAASKRVDKSLLPLHTKLIAYWFSAKSASMLCAYVLLLRRFL